MQTARDQIDAILELCVSAIQVQGHSVEECLALYPTQREDLEPLLRLAVRLQSARALQASPRFRTASLVRLQNLAVARPQSVRKKSLFPAFLSGQSLLRRPTPSLTGNRLRLMPTLALVVLMLLIVSGVGTVAASYHALPGDFLYPVKQAQENLQLTFARDEATQARLHLEFADQRIDEARSSVEKNRPSAIDQALAGYTEQIQAELTIISQGRSLSPKEQSDLAGRLLSDVTSHEASLATLIETAPQSTRENIETAITMSQKARSQAAEIIQNHPAGPGIQNSPDPDPQPDLSPGLIAHPDPNPQLDVESGRCVHLPPANRNTGLNTPAIQYQTQVHAHPWNRIHAAEHFYPRGNSPFSGDNSWPESDCHILAHHPVHPHKTAIQFDQSYIPADKDPRLENSWTWSSSLRVLEDRGGLPHLALVVSFNPMACSLVMPIELCHCISFQMPRSLRNKPVARKGTLRPSGILRMTRLAVQPITPSL